MAWYLGMTTPVYVLVLLLGSGVIAFLLYWFGVFAPGDAKLFWGVCLILPVSLFQNLSGALSFPPLVLVLNIIIPYSVALLTYLLFRFALIENKLATLRDFLMPSFKQVKLIEKLFNLFFFIGIGSGLTYLLEQLGWEPDRFVRLVVVIAVFALIRKLLAPIPKTPVYYAIVGFTCVWISVRSAVSPPAFFFSFAVFCGLYLLIFVITKQLLLSLARMTLDRSVHVNDLEVGMIPAEQIVRVSHTDGRISYERRGVVFSSGHDENIIISPDPIGLDARLIAELQQLAAADAFANFGNQIRVQSAISFAPIITVGTALTIFCQGPFHLKLIALLSTQI